MPSHVCCSGVCVSVFLQTDGDSNETLLHYVLVDILLVTFFTTKVWNLSS